MQFRTVLCVAVGCGALATIAHALTVDEWLYFGDSAELAMRSRQLGLTHPPGYPLYTWIARAAMVFVHPPAQATTWLSVAATALTVSGLVLVVGRTAGALAGALAGLVYAAHAQVWFSAVHTEVYAVNVAVLLLALTPALLPGELTRGRATAVAALYALSLAAAPANAILLPGFVLLLLGGDRSQTLRRLLVLGVSLAVVAAGIAAWTIVRAASVPPLGTGIVPDSPANFVAYVTGVEYGAIFGHGPRFYLDRVLSHAGAWTLDYAVLGIPLAVIGLHGIWTRRGRAVALGLLGIFAINACYFTCHGWSDYRTMMGPAYLVAAIAIGRGLCVGRARLGPAAALVLVVLLPGVMSFRALDNLAHARIPRSATELVDDAMTVAPEDAVVLVRWTHLTPLLYTQEIEGRRPDLRIVEICGRPRRYGALHVADAGAWAAGQAASRPIVTNAPVLAQQAGWSTTPIGRGWHRIHPPEP